MNYAITLLNLLFLGILFHLFEKIELNLFSSWKLDFLFICLALQIVLMFCFWRFNKNELSGVCLVSFFLFMASAYLGNLSSNRAFNSCVDGSEELRHELLRFKKVNGKFPNSLKELDPKFICGTRFLNPPLIQYDVTKSDFSLKFSDSFIQYVGNSTDSMEARK